MKHKPHHCLPEHIIGRRRTAVLGRPLVPFEMRMPAPGQSESHISSAPAGSNSLMSATLA